MSVYYIELLIVCDGNICLHGCFIFQRITLSASYNARCLSTGRVLAGKQVYRLHTSWAEISKMFFLVNVFHVWIYCYSAI